MFCPPSVPNHNDFIDYQHLPRLLLPKVSEHVLSTQLGFLALQMQLLGALMQTSYLGLRMRRFKSLRDVVRKVTYDMRIKRRLGAVEYY